MTLQIPDHLNRKERATAAPPVIIIQALKSDPVIAPPSLPEGLTWATSEAGETGFMLSKGIVPRRWAAEREAITLLHEELTRKRLLKAERLEQFKKVMAEKKVAAPKISRPKFGIDIRIVPPSNNPRKLNSAAYALFADMMKFMTANPRASVADVLANTSYRLQDFKADLARGNIKTDLK